ncbi:MAG: transcription termination/antitermination protein NusG [Cyanobacteria bacterium]|nr:transcription termination/antitermination protein NusG [Cyanobacteriota bacterium]
MDTEVSAEITSDTLDTPPIDGDDDEKSGSNSFPQLKNVAVSNKRDKLSFDEYGTGQGSVDTSVEKPFAPPPVYESALPEGNVEVVKTPAKKTKRWYIVHTYSGHENKVKVNLERRIESMNMGDKIFRVEVPQKSVTKIKDGKRQERDERIFPGYVLVEMVMDDDSWYVVRHTPGVTKFVGSEKKPIPAKDAEIRRILVRTGPAPTKIEIDLKVGETVRIISGPFAEFEGTVTEVHPEKEKLKASVSIFGRETPVELVFNQVQKV